MAEEKLFDFGTLFPKQTEKTFYAYTLGELRKTDFYEALKRSAKKKI